MVFGANNRLTLNTETVNRAIQEYINFRLKPGVNIKVLDTNQDEENADLFNVEIKNGGPNV